MATIAMLLKIEEENLVAALQKIAHDLGTSEGEVVVDFSSVRRIDSRALKALGDLAGEADGKEIRVVLKGVTVEIYKVLTLMRLVPKFSFTS
jgi:anti-anti-sigma regulatory factor